VLRVRRSLDTAFTPPRENPPKRRASQRPAVIFPEVAAALREHRKRQLEARMIAGPRWQESGYVFATRYGTPYRAGNVLTDSLKPLCKRAGLREFNFQALRRSSCTFLAMLGVDPKTAQRIMGHSSIVTTLSYYTEVLDEMHGAASDKMRAFLFNPS
jgi:integrase